MHRYEDSIRTAVFTVLIAIGLVCPIGCRGRETKPANPLNLMSGFVLVGTAPHVRPRGLDDKLPFVASHGLDPQTMPNQIQFGVQYIFHRRLPVDDEELALTVFPGRIKEAGMKIVGKPSITYFIEGGPIFKIQFEHKGRTGLIYNNVDVRLREASYRNEWSEHDYVLVLPN